MIAIIDVLRSRASCRCHLIALIIIHVGDVSNRLRRSDPEFKRNCSRSRRHRATRSVRFKATARRSSVMDRPGPWIGPWVRESAGLCLTISRVAIGLTLVRPPRVDGRPVTE